MSVVVHRKKKNQYYDHYFVNPVQSEIQMYITVKCKPVRHG